jgi:hypothetical protein
MVNSPPLSVRKPIPGREPAAGTEDPGGSRIEELEQALEVQKELVENLKEVIQARDLEIKYRQNTIEMQDRLLQIFPVDRVFYGIYDIYSRTNQLFPHGTRRRRLLGRLVDLLARR